MWEVVYPSGDSGVICPQEHFSKLSEWRKIGHVQGRRWEREWKKHQIVEGGKKQQNPPKKLAASDIGNLEQGVCLQTEGDSKGSKRKMRATARLLREWKREMSWMEGDVLIEWRAQLEPHVSAWAEDTAHSMTSPASTRGLGQRGQGEAPCGYFAGVWTSSQHSAAREKGNFGHVRRPRPSPFSSSRKSNK